MKNHRRKRQVNACRPFRVFTGGELGLSPEGPAGGGGEADTGEGEVRLVRGRQARPAPVGTEQGGLGGGKQTASGDLGETETSHVLNGESYTLPWGPSGAQRQRFLKKIPVGTARRADSRRRALGRQLAQHLLPGEEGEEPGGCR